MFLLNFCFNKIETQNVIFALHREYISTFVRKLCRRNYSTGKHSKTRILLSLYKDDISIFQIFHFFKNCTILNPRKSNSGPSVDFRAIVNHRQKTNLPGDWNYYLLLLLLLIFVEPSGGNFSLSFILARVIYIIQYYTVNHATPQIGTLKPLAQFLGQILATSSPCKAVP